MAQVITFEDYTPPQRFDSLPWTQVRIEEAPLSTGTWATIDTLDLDPVDVDPSDPVARSFTTELASDTADLWYRVVFLDASLDESQPSTAIQNTTAAVSPYATVGELARILKIRDPSAAQTAAMERVLLAAAGEIDSEIDLDDDTELAGWQLSLAAEVNLERAVEHWRQQESPFGLVGIGIESGSAFASRDSWERHALKLAPLKGQWGVA